MNPLASYPRAGVGRKWSGVVLLASQLATLARAGATGSCRRGGVGGLESQQARCVQGTCGSD